MTPDSLAIIAREHNAALIREAENRRLVASRNHGGARQVLAGRLRRIADRIEPATYDTPCLNC
jgi:hypothetical protein